MIGLLHQRVINRTPLIRHPQTMPGDGRIVTGVLREGFHLEVCTDGRPPAIPYQELF
jgi:hypothetical protein